MKNIGNNYDLKGKKELNFQRKRVENTFKGKSSE